MITQEILNDVFILYLSGAGEYKNKNEMWWKLDTDYEKITVEFPTGTPKHAIIRRYYNMEQIFSEIEIKNSNLDSVFKRWDKEGKIIKEWIFKNNIIQKKKIDEDIR